MDPLHHQIVPGKICLASFPGTCRPEERRKRCCFLLSYLLFPGFPHSAIISASLTYCGDFIWLEPAPAGRPVSCVLRIDLTFRIQNKIIPGGGVSMLQPVCACLGAACPPFDRSDLGTPRPPPCGWRCCPRNSQAFFFAAAARLVLADSSLINRAPSSSSLAHPS